VGNLQLGVVLAKISHIGAACHAESFMILGKLCHPFFFIDVLQSTHAGWLTE
jgi:hypothetical protein